MATYIDNTNEVIDQVAGEFWKQANNHYDIDRKIAEELFQKGEDYKDERKIQELRQGKIYALKVEAAAKIEKALSNLSEAYAEDKAKLDRIELRASTGERICEQYAAAHKISIDQARSELKEYASTKQNQFGNGLPDRYAAIRNKSNELSREDMQKAHQYYTDELRSCGYYDKEQLVKQAEYLVSNNGMQALDQWNSSGAAILRKLRNDSKQ